MWVTATKEAVLLATFKEAKDCSKVGSLDARRESLELWVCPIKVKHDLRQRLAAAATHFLDTANVLAIRDLAFRCN